MSHKLEKVLFVTSFIPVASFKSIARLGDATWGQAKIARGEIDRPKALMEGLYRVKGDMEVLSRMPQLFGARRGQNQGSPHIGSRK